MGRSCTICTHPQRPAIDTALEAGHAFRDIAAQYVISKTSLHRHWQSHSAQTPDKAHSAPYPRTGTQHTFSCDMGVVGCGDNRGFDDSGEGWTGGGWGRVWKPFFELLEHIRDLMCRTRLISALGGAPVDVLALPSPLDLIEVEK